jgi:hypothetical protein
MRGDERCARRYVADERSLSSKPAPQQQPVDEGARRHCQRVTCWARGRLRLRVGEGEAETTRRRESLPVRGEELQQLELLKCRER